MIQEKLKVEAGGLDKAYKELLRSIQSVYGTGQIFHRRSSGTAVDSDGEE